MRNIVFLISFVLGVQAFSQSTTLLIARNTGSKVLEDSTVIRTLGYAEKLSANPSMPGPTLTYYEGDSVIIDMWNVSQGAPHTIHLHGLDVDQQNDGVPHLSFAPEHMEHGFYRFKAPHPGTYLYHCHVVSVIHVQAGMYGLLIVKPQGDSLSTWDGGYSYASEYSFLLSEVDTLWHKDAVLKHPVGVEHVTIPPYVPTYFLINGLSGHQLRESDKKAFLVNDNTYLRLANIGYYANTYHFPSGLNAKIIDSDGRPLPKEIITDSLVVFPGERYGVLIAPTQIVTDSIQVDFQNLNTLKTKGTEYIHFAVKDQLAVQPLNVLKMSVSPNPFINRINVTLPNKENIVSIELYAVNGEVIQSKKESSFITTNEVPAGIYFLKVTTDSDLEFVDVVIKN